MKRLIICCVAIIFLNTTYAYAQFKFKNKNEPDATCISDQSDKLLLRAFVMQKFNKYTLGHDGISKNIAYRANDNYNIGLGFNYKWLGVNASFQMPFVNSDDGRYGKTSFYDLQSYLYLRKVAIDLFILSYKGYYMTDPGLLKIPPPNNELLIRSDLHTGNYGMNFQYIFNNERFSYRGAFVQNECQLKSAGSLIAGGGVHYTRVRADSAVIPANTLDNEFFGQHRFNKSGIIALAINGGYAYTQVIRKHFFITGSVLGGTGLNYTALKTDATDTRDSRISSQLHGIIRGVAGYNSEDYFIGIQYYNYISRNTTDVKDAWQQMQTGNIRFTFAKRFTLKKKTVKKLEQIEEKIEEKIEERLEQIEEKIEEIKEETIKKPE